MVERAFSGPTENGCHLATGRKRRAARSRGLALGLFLALSGGAHSGEIDRTVEYVISLAGINIADLDIRFTDNGSTYAVDVGANVSGVGTLVASGTASADSTGRSAGSGLSANDFSLTTRARGEEFAVDVTYASGNATGFKVSPPIQSDYGRVALERKDLAGVTDPITSFIFKGGTLSPELCNRKLRIFTGMERYDLAMSFGAMQTATSERTGYQGPVALCRVKYIPISGHYENSEVTDYLAHSDKILVWYAPLDKTGYFIPYRVLMGTAAGDLSMVMTSLN